MLLPVFGVAFLVVSAPALVVCVQRQARLPCDGYVWCGCVLSGVAETVVVLLVDLLGGEEGRRGGREGGRKASSSGLALQRQKQGTRERGGDGVV